MIASATTVSAAAMVMTNRGSTLPAAHRSAPAAWVVTSSTSAPLSTLDADEEQDGVAAHRDTEHAEAHEGGGEQVGAGEVDHGATSLLGGVALALARLLAGDARDRQGRDRGHEQQQREQLEGPHPGAEQLARDLGRGDVGALHRPARERQHRCGGEA